jgi:hypothetical protein
MEDTIQLYRTLLGNRAYQRSLAEGAAFLAASTIAIFAARTDKRCGLFHICPATCLHASVGGILPPSGTERGRAARTRLNSSA